MSKMSESVGVSKGVFVAGLIATLLLSVIFSYGVLVVTSPQGIPGDRGEKGHPGGVEPSVSAELTSTFTEDWLGANYHTVEGLVINFGSGLAYDVAITVTWHTLGGAEHTEPADTIGNFWGYRIYEYSKRYYIEGDFDYITWEIASS